MDKGNKQLTHHELADQFIKLANDLAANESIEKVSAALLFAAARYNSFEAASKSQNLTMDKPDVFNWFTKEYSRMLEFNLEEHIELLSKSNYTDAK